MSNYLFKYKGKYRLLPEIDKSTNDFPRDCNGLIIDDDIYISCYYGNKIMLYGHINNSKTVWLTAYIPSIIRGRHIIKSLDEQGIKYIDYEQTDSEVLFKFSSKDIEPVAVLLKAKTAGANISPFSTKNLPKSNVEIPYNEMKKYKAITAKVNKSDILIIHNITNRFLEDILQNEVRCMNRNYNYKVDMKQQCMARQSKEFIYTHGYWGKYLNYLDKEITSFYKSKN